MQTLEILRCFAAVVTIVAAILVAINISPKLMIAGFALFIVASIAWMIDGMLEGKTSLIVQNAVLLLVNIAGVLRWLPEELEAGRESEDVSSILVGHGADEVIHC